MAFYARSSSYGLNDGKSLETYNALQEEMKQMCRSSNNSYSEPPFAGCKRYKITNDMLKLNNIDNFELPFGSDLNKVEKTILKDFAKTMRKYYMEDNDNCKKCIPVFYKLSDCNGKFRRKKVQRFLDRNNDYFYTNIYKDKEKDLIMFDLGFFSDLRSVEHHRHTFCRTWNDETEKIFNNKYNRNHYKHIAHFYLN